jgi:hypothetical protein
MKSRSNKLEIFIISALILQVFVIIYIKYDNQFISLKNFELFLTGNLLTIIFYSVLIFEIIFFFKKYKIKPAKTYLLLFLSYLFLGLGYYSNHIQMPFNKYYFFGQYGNKLFTGLCFTLHLFIIVYFAFYIFYSKTKPKVLSGKALLATVILMITFLLFSNLFILLNENKLNEKSISNKKIF